MGKGMAFTDRDVATDPDMKIRDIGEAALADTALLGADHSGNRAGDLHDGFFGIRRDACIHHVA